MPEQALKDKTAVAGVGWTDFVKASGTTPLNLVARASLRAIEDAGLTVGDIDGVVTFRHGPIPRLEPAPTEIAAAIGIQDCSYEHFSNLGGTQVCSAVASAAMAVHSGLCRNVLVYYGSNGSSRRLPATERASWPVEIAGARHNEFLVGSGHAAIHYAPPVVAHMNRYGTTSVDMGHVAVTQREHARLNIKAVMRKELTIEAHQNSPWIVWPYRLFDCCLQTDGAVALVISSSQQARDLRHSPVYIMSASGSFEGGEEPWETGAARTAKKLYDGAGITAADVDLAELYDPFTGMCMLHMEGFGLAPEGESGAWVRARENALDGAVPVNTHGGLLSEGHLHGLNSVVEAVQQLRIGGVADDLCPSGHDYDRSHCRQVRDPSIALVCGESGASALLLRKAS